MARRPIDLLAFCVYGCAMRGAVHGATQPGCHSTTARRLPDNRAATTRRLLAEDYVPELTVLVDSAAMGAVFWNAHGAWVEHGNLWVISALHVHFSVRVTVHKRVHTWRLRPLVNAVVNARAKNVAVSKEDGELLACLGIFVKQDVVVSHAREVQNHLVNLRLAVSADRNNLIGNAIQHLNDALWCIICRKIVARAVIEQVSKKQNVLWLLLLNDLHEFLAIVGSAVNI